MRSLAPLSLFAVVGARRCSSRHAPPFSGKEPAGVVQIDSSATTMRRAGACDDGDDGAPQQG